MLFEFLSRHLGPVSENLDLSYNRLDLSHNRLDFYHNRLNLYHILAHRMWFTLH